MLRNVTLDENGGDSRVESDREQRCGQFERLLSDDPRSIRRGQSMKIDDSVEGVVLRLPDDPLAQGPEIVAQVNLACGLNAGQDSRHSPRLPFSRSLPQKSNG